MFISLRHSYNNKTIFLLCQCQRIITNPTLDNCFVRSPYRIYRCRNLCGVGLSRGYRGKVKLQGGENRD
ncbi:hypothetical protein B9Z19DRAFT_1092043, partial [Tuber borchii]